MIKRWPALNKLRGLRFQLIGWYAILLIITLVIFSGYFFYQFRELQQAQQDGTLQSAGAKLRNYVDLDHNTPFFRFNDNNDTRELLNENVRVRLYDDDGDVVQVLGNAVDAMPTATQPPRNDDQPYTVEISPNEHWRIYLQPLFYEGSPRGWLEIGQPEAMLNTAFSELLVPILLGSILALVLGVFGGLFLANRALQPIVKVTRTAQKISTQDLVQRINYHGPPDEIGQLAKTFDQMLDRLETGFEQERRFTSDASHELRTPLTALKGRIEVTLNRSRSSEEYQETLLSLDQEVDRLIRLTNSLLYLARLDQANMQWQAETLDISDFLDSIVESMQPVAELKEINLSGNFSPNLHVHGNLDQLTRLFLNLIDNALKYTPAGGSVKVNLQKVARSVVVTVTDNGPGIAAEHLPHLFKRFYRAESDRGSDTGGTGLGLAIAYEIARQNGGTLSIESQVGQGTTLRVEFPLLETSQK